VKTRGSSGGFSWLDLALYVCAAAALYPVFHWIVDGIRKALGF